MRNILLVLKDYNSACSVLKKTDHNIYLYKCQTTKFDVIEYLDDAMFDRIDTIILNEKSHQSRVEYLVNSFTGDKTIHLFSNLNCTITNAKCVFYNYIKLDKIMSQLNATDYEPVQKQQVQPSPKSKRMTEGSTHIDDNKTRFRNLCMTLLDNLRNTHVPNIMLHQPKEAVLIEYRQLPHVEVLLRNCIAKLGAEWSYTVVCGNDSFLFYTNVCKSIHANIRVINTKHSDMTQNIYNNMLLTTDFWQLFSCDKMLIYQEDTFIFKNNIDEFMNWDYIGAPFQMDCVEGHNVGNGGLSIRSRNKMLDVLTAIPPHTVSIFEVKPFVRKFMSHKNLDNIPEDVYYATYLQKLNIGTVPNVEIASEFSSETIYNKNSFGMHCYWLGDGKHTWKEHFEGFVASFGDNRKDTIQSFISENDVKFTRPMFTKAKCFMKNTQTAGLDDLNSFVLIVDFYNGGGGTTTFLNFITSKYKFYNNFIIVRENKFNCFVTLNDDYCVFENISCAHFFDKMVEHINKIDYIFVNHFFGLSNSFIDNVLNLKKYKKKLYTITHDYYHFYDKPQPMFTDNFQLKHNKIVDKFDIIFTQHETNLQYFKGANLQIIDMPDYKNKLEQITHKNQNCVGIIGNIHQIKGLDILTQLVETNIDIQFIIFGHANLKKYKNLHIYPYSNVIELNDILKKCNPNVLLELSIWPETYSFTLTLAHIINLPLLILHKPCECTVVNRAKKLGINYHIFSECDNFRDLVNVVSKRVFCTIEPKIYYNRKLDELFIKNYYKNTLLYARPKYDKYFIYFPQFYEMPENNANFYTGYNDAINLDKLLNSNYLNEVLTPNYEYLNISGVTQYNVQKNRSIVKKQLKLIEEYKSGIACYYYWFTTNTITNKNMIMKETVDMLFNNCEHSNSIFFIWANEDWSKNVAFGNSNNKIENIYDESSIKVNCNNLMTYFKHDCYLKKNNKPVLMIYHTWLITSYQLNCIKSIIDDLCIENGFNGCEIYLNTMNEYYSFDTKKFKQFKMNFDYKTNKGSRYIVDKQIVLDYENYIDIITPLMNENTVQTISLDFDNNARLIKPNKSQFSTRCIKNYHFLKVKFIKNVLKNYSYLGDENIILINSFNEWGEKMACEPSNETGYYYLNLIKELV